MLVRLRFAGGILYVWLGLCLITLLIVILPQLAFAQNASLENNTRMLSRGEVVYRIVDAFDLTTREKTFLTSCREHLDECFFVFSAMSDFDDISFDPLLRLYPDLSPHHRYFEAINVASMLGLIHGYLHEDGTPFRPESVMTRIQALKVVLGAADLLEWKDRFELSSEELAQATLYLDEVLSTPEGWWYNRYLNFAYKNSIIPPSEYFRPDDIVTVAELQEMINNTHDFMAARTYDQKAFAGGDSEQQTVAVAG